MTRERLPTDRHGRRTHFMENLLEIRQAPICDVLIFSIGWFAKLYETGAFLMSDFFELHSEKVLTIPELMSEWSLCNDT